MSARDEDGVLLLVEAQHALLFLLLFGAHLQGHAHLAHLLFAFFESALEMDELLNRVVPRGEIALELVELLGALLVALSQVLGLLSVLLDLGRHLCSLLLRAGQLALQLAHLPRLCLDIVQGLEGVVDHLLHHLGVGLVASGPLLGLVGAGFCLVGLSCGGCETGSQQCDLLVHGVWLGCLAAHIFPLFRFLQAHHLELRGKLL